VVKRGVFGTAEWASHSRNILSGCSHDCRYCYAKTQAIRFGRKTKTTWHDEEVKKRLKKGARLRKLSGTILFPSAHDITPGHDAECLAYLQALLAAGNNLLIVSKPHYACISKICDSCAGYRDQILFRFTIGSADTGVLKFWEPGAPDFDERLGTLAMAFSRGYQTSVSCEPMLDDNIGAVVDAVRPYVTNAIWLGKANRLVTRLRTNGETGRETLRRAEELIAWQSDGNIRELYETYRKDPKIKYKESIKKVVGLKGPTEKGLDI
jgi:DNA repair photolyase